MSNHKPIRYNDEYQCARCGKSWGVGEEEPPCVEPRHHSEKEFKNLDYDDGN